MATKREIRQAIAHEWCNAQSPQSFAECYAADAANIALSISLTMKCREDASPAERQQIDVLLAEFDGKFTVITDAIVDALLGRW